MWTENSTRPKNRWITRASRPGVPAITLALPIIPPAQTSAPRPPAAGNPGGTRAANPPATAPANPPAAPTPHPVRRGPPRHPPCGQPTRRCAASRVYSQLLPIAPPSSNSNARTIDNPVARFRLSSARQGGGGIRRHPPRLGLPPAIARPGPRPWVKPSPPFANYKNPRRARKLTKLTPALNPTTTKAATRWRRQMVNSSCPNPAHGPSEPPPDRQAMTGGCVYSRVKFTRRPANQRPVSVPPCRSVRSERPAGRGEPALVRVWLWHWELPRWIRRRDEDAGRIRSVFCRC